MSKKMPDWAINHTWKRSWIGYKKNTWKYFRYFQFCTCKRCWKWQKMDLKFWCDIGRNRCEIGLHPSSSLWLLADLCCTPEANFQWHGESRSDHFWRIGYSCKLQRKWWQWWDQKSDREDTKCIRFMKGRDEWAQDSNVLVTVYKLYRCDEKLHQSWKVEWLGSPFV